MEDLSIKLRINGAYTQDSVHPVFGDDIKVNISREDNQIFRREKIEGTFKFVGKDFDLIHGCSPLTKFTLEIYRGDEFVGSAEFIHTDCEFNFDDKICSVKLETHDVYEKILNSYDEEYNLVRLAPKKESVTMAIRPVLQFYVRGANVVTNVIGGVYYEQSCQEVYDTSKLTDTYHFEGFLPLAYFEVTQVDSQYLPTGMLGRYSIKAGGQGITSETVIYWNEQNPRYRAISANNETHLEIVFTDVDAGENIATVEVNAPHTGTTEFEIKNTDSSPVVCGKGVWYADGSLFCRVLLPQKFEGAYQRSMNDDITDYDSNYPYIKGIPLSTYAPKITMVLDKSVEPTEWTTDSEGKYFESPTLDESQQKTGVSPIPIGQTHWERMSSWLLYDDAVGDLVAEYAMEFELKDSYPLWSAISVLLNKVDSSLSFAGDAAHSKFLCVALLSDVPFLSSYNAPTSRDATLHIAPITNIKKTTYEQAAQRGDISLKQILDMLRNVYNCYWFIDEEKRLRIEHIVYFKNGNTYSAEEPIPTIDITGKLSLPSKEGWDFAQNTVSFETGKCSSRYEFKWGDDCTYPFNGEPIDIKDIYIDSSRKESVSIDNFLSDIDYIISNPSEISNDLYAVYEANINTRKVAIADIRLTDTSPKYYVQNPYMAMIAAERFYYPFDLSGWRAYADGKELEVYKTKEIKKQSLSCPLTLDEMRSIGVARTEVGVGVINELSAEINTLYANNTIYYENVDSVSDKIQYGLVLQGKMLVNNPTLNKVRLNVGIVEDSKIVSTQELVIPLKGAGVITDISDTREPITIDAEDISSFTINRRFLRMDGYMRLDDSGSSNGVYKLVISTDKSRNGSDWAGIHITANAKIKITVAASTSGYGHGYTSQYGPSCSELYKTELLVTGTGTKSVTIDAGESRYIGFCSIPLVLASGEKVTVTIEEI